MLWASVWGLHVGLQNLKDEGLPGEEEKAVGEERSYFQQEEQHG